MTTYLIPYAAVWIVAIVFEICDRAKYRGQ